MEDVGIPDITISSPQPSAPPVLSMTTVPEATIDNEAVPQQPTEDQQP